MKIFIDTANLAEIEEALKRGFIQGITTNPSLLSKEPKGSFQGHIEKIISLIKKYRQGIHLSVEVFSTDPAEIVRQALEFQKLFQYKQLSVKVQIGWNELETIRQLSSQGISVNCTACMTISQAMMAIEAGAAYVSLFWGRIRDGGVEESAAAAREELKKKNALDAKDFDPAFVTQSVRQIIDREDSKTQIIIGSIRSIADIRDAALAGAHIATVPPKFFPDMVKHFKTDQVVQQFLTDFKGWLA